MATSSKDPGTLPEYLNARAVSHALGISEKTVYRHAASGILPGTRIGGSLRFNRITLRDYLQRNTRTACARGQD